VILPPEIEPGLYILTLRVDDTEKDQLFLALTQNALVVKQSGSNLFVWASAVDGEAASEIEVRLYSSRGESIREGKTDQNGFYRTTIPAGYEPLFVAARGGEGDVSIAGLTTYAWRTSNGNYYVRGAEVPEYNIYTYTDRPIYRPGQTMYFKSILRSDRDVRFSVPPMGTPVTVRVRDGRENIVQTFKLTTNNLGTINGEFQIADGASLGNYSIEVTIGSTSQQQAFKVQEYRKPDIQVELTANADKYVIGDTVVITGNTSYFFGEPVPNAQITVVKYYLVENYSWGWWNEEVEIPDYTWYQYYGEEAQDLSTDAEGNFSYAFTAQELDEYNRRNSWRSSLQESLWGFEVTVDDGSGQTVSSAIIVRVYNAANKISLDPGGYFKSPGKSFTVSALAVTLDDAPVPDRLLTLEVTRWDWEDNTDTEIATYQMTTGADGKASQSITLGQSGYYKLNLTGQDERGNPIAYSTWCYAYQPGQS